MTGNGTAPEDGPDGDLDDDVIEELRRINPVDVEDLPSSRGPEASRTLERILGSDDAEPEPDPSDTEDDCEHDPEADNSSPSPAAGDRSGREAPPPRPESR